MSLGHNESSHRQFSLFSHLPWLLSYPQTPAKKGWTETHLLVTCLRSQLTVEVFQDFLRSCQSFSMASIGSKRWYGITETWKKTHFMSHSTLYACCWPSTVRCQDICGTVMIHFRSCIYTGLSLDWLTHPSVLKTQVGKVWIDKMKIYWSQNQAGSVNMMMSWHGNDFPIVGRVVTSGFPSQRDSNSLLWCYNWC